MLQEREGDVRSLNVLGRECVHPHSLRPSRLGSGAVPVRDLLGHLTLVAVANEVLATRRGSQAHSSLGARGQTDVVVGVTVGSAAPGRLWSSVSLAVLERA